MKKAQEQIERLRTLVRKCYGAVFSKGGDVPEDTSERTVENLPSAVDSIRTNKCAFDYYFFHPKLHYAYDEVKNYKELYNSYACLVFKQGTVVVVNDARNVIKGVEKIIFEDGSEQDVVENTAIDIPIVNNEKDTSYIHVVSTNPIELVLGRISFTSIYAYNCAITPNTGASGIEKTSIILEKCNVNIGEWGNGFSAFTHLKELKYIDCKINYTSGKSGGSFYNTKIDVYEDYALPSIDSSCFQHNYSLRYIDTPNVKYIHDSNALPLRAVGYMNFPNLERIGNNVFRDVLNGENLKWIFPKLSEIGANCFPTSLSNFIEVGTLLSLGTGSFQYHYGFIQVGKDTDCNLPLNTWGHNNGLLNHSAGGDAKLMGDTIMEQLVENLKDNSQTGVTRTITLNAAIKNALGYGTESAHPLFAMLSAKNWTVA